MPKPVKMVFALGAGAAERRLLALAPSPTRPRATRRDAPALSTSAQAVPSGYLRMPCCCDDQRAAQRDHHQDAEQAAEHRDQHHARDLQVEAEDQDRRHRDADAEGDRLARRAGGLHDVVLEDRRVAAARASTSSRNSVIEMTATGIEALTVRPTLSTR